MAASPCPPVFSLCSRRSTGTWGGLQVTAGRCLGTTLTWGCQGCSSVTEVTSTDEQGRSRVLRRNDVLAKDATSEYHTSILANNIGEAFTPTRGCAKKWVTKHEQCSAYSCSDAIFPLETRNYWKTLWLQYSIVICPHAPTPLRTVISRAGYDVEVNWVPGNETCSDVPFPGQFLCWLQPGCLHSRSLRGEAHQKPAGVSHHSFSEFNQEKEKIWRAGSSPLSLLTGVSSTRPWGDGSEPVCKGRKGWQMEEAKMNCIKILKISQHAEKQNEGGKRGKGREHENLGRPARLLTPEKSEGLLPRTMAEEGLRRVSVSRLCKRLSPNLDLWNIIALKVITACLEGILSQLGLCSWASRLMWTKAKSYCQCIATQNDTCSAVMKSALDVFWVFFC